jgi:hypothetical protein
MHAGLWLLLLSQAGQAGWLNKSDIEVGPDEATVRPGGGQNTP